MGNQTYRSNFSSEERASEISPGFSYVIRTFTALVTNSEIVGNASTAAFTIYLPSQPPDGHLLSVMKSYADTSLNAITIQAGSADTIEGSSTTTLNTFGESVQLIYIAQFKRWFVLERRIPAVWTSYTPTGSLSTATSYTGFWRREGDSVIFRARASFIGDPGAYSSVTLNIPNSATWTINTSKLPTTTNLEVGRISLRRAGNVYLGRILYNSTTAVQLFMDRVTGSYVDMSALSDSVPHATDFANGDYYNVISDPLPITGWNG